MLWRGEKRPVQGTKRCSQPHCCGGWAILGEKQLPFRVTNICDSEMSYFKITFLPISCPNLCTLRLSHSHLQQAAKAPRKEMLPPRSREKIEPQSWVPTGQWRARD